MNTHSARPSGRAGLLAGVMLLLMAVLGGFGYLVAVAGSVTEGDAARTTQDLLQSRALFGAGILSQAAVIALDVLVAWALYRFLEPVSRVGALLAAVVRTAYAAVYAVALVHLVAVFSLLGTSRSPAPDDVMAGITRFADTWDTGLILFGAHLLVLGWLGLRSGYVPRLVAVLLGIAGVGYVVDSIGSLASSGPWTDVSTFTFVGEFLFAVWLVVDGVRHQRADRLARPHAHEELIDAAR